MKKLFLVAVSSLLLFSCQQEKTAYVKSNELFDNYQPIKDAEAKFKKQENNIQSGMQSQVTAFQEEVQKFRQNQESMSEEELQAKQQELMQKQQQLRQMQQMQMQGIDQQRKKTMDSLNQAVKSAVAEYAKDNGYTYIFGMDKAGRQILYASDSKNVTDDVLEELNEDSNSGDMENEDDAMESNQNTDTTTEN